MGDVVDVLIVGAGPAGATAALAALAARPGADVRLLDAAAFPRDKACGDGIAPHAFAEWAELGVQGLAEGYGPLPGLDLHSPGGVRVLARPPRSARVIPREVLDARLIRAAVDAGATLLQHRVRKIELGPDRVTLDGEHSGRVVIARTGGRQPADPDAAARLAGLRLVLPAGRRQRPGERRLRPVAVRPDRPGAAVRHPDHADAGAACRAAAVTPGGAAAGAAYRVALDRSLGRHLRHTAVLARLSRRSVMLDAAFRAVADRPDLMDRLVDLGLGDGLIPPTLLPRTVVAYLAGSRFRTRGPRRSVDARSSA